MKFQGLLAIPLLCAVVCNGFAGVPDEPFVQEIHEPRPIGEGKGMNDTRAVGLDAEGTAWVATGAGIFALRAGERKWVPLQAKREAGPTFAVATDPERGVWIGAWNGLYRAAKGPRVERVPGIDRPVSAIGFLREGGLLAMGPDGAWRVDADGKATREPSGVGGSIRAIVDHPSGLWIATTVGLYKRGDSGVQAFQSDDALISPLLRGLSFDHEGRLWAGGVGGVTILRDGRREGQLSTAEGLPCMDVRAVAAGPDGRMWLGTALGVARYDGKNWSLRHGRRWLLDDDVRGIALAGDGAAWIATGEGVSVIRPINLTLEEKAARLLKICYARHIRAPGLVEKCRLRKKGDLSTWEPRDDDNDGQYTSMYLAMQSYRYAATRDPDARARAHVAFKALEFLREVAGPNGFFARTVIPVSWKHMQDHNEGVSEREWAERRVADPTDKPVEIHWRVSSDGKWRWKTDTSSDEAVGHFYGYLTYFDLAADEADRAALANHVGRIMDHLIACGYNLCDVDGKPTRWGAYSPDALNRDPRWVFERGVNSAEILGFLKVAHHITGDAKYRSEYIRLAREEGYGENARGANVMNPALRTHIDDELLAMIYPMLMLPEDDADLVAIYRESMEGWGAWARREHSPFFNFAYAAAGGKAGPDLENSVAYLRDSPLDMIRWKMDNSQREDIQLTRLPEFDSVQTSRLLPPSERAVSRWDDNPWLAVAGDGGKTESDGVYWLLPYWMGRRFGYIDGAGAGGGK